MCAFNVCAADAKTSTLFLEFSKYDGYIEANSSFDGDKKSAELSDKDGALTKRMKRLYMMLQDYDKHSDDEFVKELQETGNIFYGPFHDAIEGAEVVAIRIPMSMTRFPFEQMYHDKKPLGLQKQIVVYSGKYPEEKLKFSDIETALVLADLTADPEKACKAMAKKLDDATYRDLAEVDKDYLKDLRAHDLLLVSAHGDVTFEEEDCIDIGKKEIYPDSWAKVAPELAYFDSCQLGASRDFIEAFQEAGTKYFVAPITSNEAGNSSTKTIKLFFENFMDGDTPEKAMLKAKTSLFELYSVDKDMSYGKLLYRVLPFRVYRLN